MIKNSLSKQKLRLAHQVLDKQLSNGLFNQHSTAETNYLINRKQNKYPEKEDVMSKNIMNGSQGNIQCEISQLQKKLQELQRKMQNIDVSSSSNSDDDKNKILKIIKQRKQKSNPLSSNLRQQQQQKEQIKRQYTINSKAKHQRVVNQKKAIIMSNQSEEEDSQDDRQVYQKILGSSKQNKLIHKENKKNINSIGQKLHQYQAGVNLYQNFDALQNKQSGLKQIVNNKLMNTKQIFDSKQNGIENKSQKITKANRKGSEKKQNSMRNSVKSIKSRKSTKSKQSMLSLRSEQKLGKNQKKLNNSISKQSLNSKHSKNKHNLNDSHERVSGSDLKNMLVENAKDDKRINNLQRQLIHYKKLCQKQQLKLQDYRVMEIEYRKLRNNFSKSQQIRAQQKRIIASFKLKN